MRILIASHLNYPHVGGHSNYIKSLKSGLEDLGHVVDIVSLNSFAKHTRERLNEELSDEAREECRRRYGKNDPMVFGLEREIRMFERLFMQIDLSKYDIWHAQDTITGNALGRIKMKRKTGSPLLLTLHGLRHKLALKFNKVSKGSVRERYLRDISEELVRHPDKIIIISNHFRKALKEFGARDSKMVTVYTGIEFHVPARERRRGELTMTSVSRLGPRKGHEFMLEALSMIKKDLKGVKVQLVGDGPQREVLEEKAKELGLREVVQFLGLRRDIPYILSQSDIFVHPSVNDNLPICIIEAMFGRQAIVATDVGGVTEIIENGKNGLIVEPGNVQELAKSIRMLIRRPKLRKWLAYNAWESAEQRLTLGRMAKEMEKVYSSFL